MQKTKSTDGLPLTWCVGGDLLAELNQGQTSFVLNSNSPIFLKLPLEKAGGVALRQAQGERGYFFAQSCPSLSMYGYW
jgi:hypothetical protein